MDKEIRRIKWEGGGAVKIKERMWEGIVDAIPFEKVILKYVHTYILKEFKWCYLTDHHRLTNKKSSSRNGLPLFGIVDL